MPIPAKTSEVSTYWAWERPWLEAEAQCVESGGNPERFPQGLLRWLDGGSFLPPGELLAGIESKLPRLFRDPDPRLVLAEAFQDLWNRRHPFAPISRVHARTGDGWTDLWLKVGTPVDGNTLDLAWLLLPLFRGFPRAFSLPEYEKAQAVADPRPLHAILGEDRDREPAESLARLLDKAGIPAPEGWDMGSLAWPARADYNCPRRRRMVIQAGCAYGAPGFLFRLGFRSLRPQDWNPLRLIIPALAGPWDRAGKAADPLDAGAILVREPGPVFSAPHRFVYHQADDSISCDGRHLTKRVPARILRRVVRDFVESGRREFEFRAFKRDSEIVTNRKRPNFEVRLRRVLEVIRSVPCGLILHRRKPGLLELETSGPIEYAEEGETGREQKRGTAAR